MQLECVAPKSLISEGIESEGPSALQNFGLRIRDKVIAVVRRVNVKSRVRRQNSQAYDG